MCVGLLVALAGVTGCSVDKQIDKFAKKNDAMVAALDKTESAEEAKKVYEKHKEKVKPLWTAVKDARGFQFTDESKKQLQESALNGVTGVCKLKLRGHFDEKAKKTYKSLCEDYAGLLELSPESASATIMDKEFEVESLADDLKEARKKLKNGESLTLSCANLDTHVETGEKYGFDEQVEEFKSICNYKGPLNVLKTAVKEAEKARKKNPDESVLSECYNSEKDTAVETLKKNGKAEDKEVASLQKRWKEACGDKG